MASVLPIFHNITIIGETKQDHVQVLKGNKLICGDFVHSSTKASGIARGEGSRIPQVPPLHYSLNGKLNSE